MRENDLGCEVCRADLPKHGVSLMSRPNIRVMKCHSIPVPKVDVQAAIPEPSDEFYLMLQRAQGRNPQLNLPVTPMPPTVPPTPAVAADGHVSDPEDDMPLAAVFSLPRRAAPTGASIYRVMLYKASATKPCPIIALRERCGSKSQIGQAKVVTGLTVEKAMEVAGRFGDFLAEGAIQEQDVSELLADTFCWLAEA